MSSIPAVSSLSAAASSSSQNESQEISGFICPLTYELMEDPVMAPSGHTYERISVEKAILLYGKDPLTQSPLKKEQLTPNRALLQAICEWKQKHTPTKQTDLLKETKALKQKLAEQEKRALDKSKAIEAFHESVFKPDTSSDVKAVLTPESIKQIADPTQVIMMMQQQMQMMQKQMEAFSAKNQEQDILKKIDSLSLQGLCEELENAAQNNDINALQAIARSKRFEEIPTEVIAKVFTIAALKGIYTFLETVCKTPRIQTVLNQVQWPLLFNEKETENHIKILTVLNTHHSFLIDKLLPLAAKFGNMQILRQLITSSPYYDISQVLSIAVTNNQLEFIHYLITHHKSYCHLDTCNENNLSEALLIIINFDNKNLIQNTFKDLNLHKLSLDNFRKVCVALMIKDNFEIFNLITHPSSCMSNKYNNCQLLLPDAIKLTKHRFIDFILSCKSCFKKENIDVQALCFEVLTSRDKQIVNTIMQYESLRENFHNMQERILIRAIQEGDPLFLIPFLNQFNCPTTWSDNIKQAISQSIIKAVDTTDISDREIVQLLGTLRYRWSLYTEPFMVHDRCRSYDRTEISCTFLVQLCLTAFEKNRLGILQDIIQNINHAGYVQMLTRYIRQNTKLNKEVVDKMMASLSFSFLF